ncbi:putative ABC transport system ATP-binding protein [Mesorhizobium soli]|uniref:ABC transporter ATP-binding protein n=1 Tax=Pseudaminobacter soli (ex Li et al. 2025) TaxID=1295366 RepID=UPI002474D491|nr:ABC transporter ATP-binding protein [Mesorhizobium soli]MDH6234773.1 putative ABC transport system ATP-binding protein [Mesorhizobium soli]
MEADVRVVPVALTMVVLEAHELYRFYHVGDDETAALRGVSLALTPGEMVAIVGPSGSGKSTLLSCLTGLDEPDGGYVKVGNIRMTRRPEAERAAIRATSFGILLQSANLFQHLTVAENITLPMLMAGAFDSPRLGGLLSAVGLDVRAKAYPRELSGGETARAGLAVALATDPLVLVADEPTAEVDRQTEARLMFHLEARRAAGKTTLLATHSEALASRADRILHLRDGKIINE